MDNTAASTERTIHIRICHRLWFRAFNMYIFKIPGFYKCPISWVHFIQSKITVFLRENIKRKNPGPKPGDSFIAWPSGPFSLNP